jgi:RNA polymerase sigma-70 factor (ECF subfamily)
VLDVIGDGTLVSDLEHLATTEGGRLLRLARRFLPCEEDARDAVQDAFVAAFRAIGDFESAALLSTWLHRIVVNACLMKLRRRRRKPEEDIAVADEPWCESAEAAVQRTQTCALVRKAIQRLPEPYRTVLMLRDIEEMETADVAALLGATPNAVKIRLHRGRQALRPLLEAHLRTTVARP